MSERSAAPIPTLYEWVGGLDALTRLTRHFYSIVPNDPLIGPVFAAMPPNHFEHVALFLAEVLGGPRATRRTWPASAAGTRT